MGWGVPKRPTIGDGPPDERGGSDGDIRINKTNLGAKLFAKAQGLWYDAPLGRDGVYRFGTNKTNHLLIDSDSVDIIKNNTTVASFSSDITLTGGSINMNDGTRNRIIIGSDDIDFYDEAGNNVLNIDTGVVIVGDADNEHVKIASSGIDIKDGSVQRASFTDDISFNGKLIIGKQDGTFNATDNIIIGSDQSDNQDMLQNICIGYQAGKDMDGSSCALNVAIGYQAGENFVGSCIGNACMGAYAGDTLANTSSYSTCIGYQSDGASNGVNQIAIGNGAVASGTNVGIWGNASVSTNNITVDWTVTSDRRIKKDIKDSDIGLLFVNSLKPRQFKKLHPSEWDVEILEKRYKEGGSNYDDDKNEVIKDEFDEEKVWNGLIAQEVKESMDDLGVEFSGWYEAPDSKQGIQYATLVVPLTKAVQELSAKIDTMQIEINNLKTE